MLRALHLPERLAQGALRVSFGRDNSEDDAVVAGQTLRAVFAKLQKKKAAIL